MFPVAKARVYRAKEGKTAFLPKKLLMSMSPAAQHAAPKTIIQMNCQKRFIEPLNSGSTKSKRGVITIHPEFPHEQSPELFSIILLIDQVILEKEGYIFRIEESLPPTSVRGK